MFLEFCKIMCIILLSITLIFLIPFLINLSFKYSSIDLFSAEWSAGDLLSFYGTMLSFIGTTFLGCLTLYQNHTIKKNSDDRMKDLEKAEHDRNMPKFYITFSSCSGNKKHLSINLINISENIATNISISKIQDKIHSTITYNGEELTYAEIINNQSNNLVKAILNEEKFKGFSLHW